MKLEKLGLTAFLLFAFLIINISTFALVRVTQANAAYSGRISKDCGDSFYPAIAPMIASFDSLVEARIWGERRLSGDSNAIFLYELNILTGNHVLTWVKYGSECDGLYDTWTEVVL